MKKFSTIIFLYNNENRVIYQICSEFMRMAGIWCRACEKKYSKEVEEFQDYPETLFCDIEKNLQLLAGKDFVADVDTQNHVLEKLIDFCDVEAPDVWRKMKDIFLKYNLFKGSLTILYIDRKSNLLEKAGEQFYLATTDINAEIKRGEKNKYFNYAKFYCMEKSNKAKYLCDEQIHFVVGLVEDECKEFIQKYPDFTNIYVLMGKIYDICTDEIDTSIIYYAEAQNNMKGHPCLSTIQYYIARRCIGYNILVSIKNEYYKRAYQTFPNRYKIVYRMAITYLEKEQWEDAFKVFKICLSLLEDKHGYMDLQEEFYCFSVYLHIAYILLNKYNDMEKTIDYAKKAIELVEFIRNKKEPYIRICYQIFGKNYEEYLKEELLLLQRTLKKINIYYAKAFEDMGEYDESDKYWRLSEEE